eukprot:Skav223040  [mRNA]  locus=scaffold1069:129406:134370:+ [translate_table: standard]
MECIYHASEVCAGIGCLSGGLETAGIQVDISNELREKLVQFQQLQGKEVIQGNIGDNAVIAQLHSKMKGSGIMTGGFSCQPWSHLGDKRAATDQRASSLPFMLRAAYFTRAHTVIMECVVGAGKDGDVIRTINEFCAWTGYRRSEIELHLNHIMPARRDRWWCVLTSPTWPCIHLRPLPTLHPLPCIRELLPLCPQWDEKASAALELNRFETTRHEMYGGIYNKLVDLNGQLATALHGWANQLSSCPCGCRDFPMSEHRLETKGLFAALVMLEGNFPTAYQGNLPKTRHLHPWELATLHGVVPDLDFSQGLRLAIAGLGQMASPIQSNWVVGQVLHQIEVKYDMPTKMPEVRLGDHFRKFFSVIAQQQPVIASQPEFCNFVQRLRDTLELSIAAHQVPSPIATPPVDPNPVVEECESKTETITRAGRQDLKRIDDKQPPTRPEEPEKSEGKQPAVEPQELLHDDHGATHDTSHCSFAHDHHHDMQSETHTSVDHHHLRPEQAKPLATGSTFAQGLTAVVTKAIEARLQAMQPPMEVEEGERDDPGHQDSLQPSRGENLPINGNSFAHHHHADHQEEEEGVENAGQEVAVDHPMMSSPARTPDATASPEGSKGEVESHQHSCHDDEAMQPRILHEGTGDEGATLATLVHSKIDHQPPPAEATQVYSAQGGLQAFASLREVHPPQPGNMDSAELTREQMRNIFTQPLSDATPTEPAIEPVAVAPAPQPILMQIHLHMRESEEPVMVQVPQGTTVGEITKAELQIGCPDQPLRVTNVVGRFMPPEEVLQPFQQLFINMHHEQHSMRGTTHLHDQPPPFLDFPTMTRRRLLHHQGPWVEAGEYQFYLQTLMTDRSATPVAPCVVPLYTMDDELQDTLMAWAAQCITQLPHHHVVASAFLVHDHWFPVVLREHAMGIRLITTNEAVDWVDIAFQAYTHRLGIVKSPLPWSHTCDCGFQSLGWTVEQVDSIRAHQDIPEAKAVSEDVCIRWRAQFENFLTDKQLSNIRLSPATCRFGGVNHQDLGTFVSDLLSTHGVPVEAIKDRTQQVMETLTRQQLVQVSRSAQPWRDLKAIANQARPKLQLVLAGELNQRIQERAAKATEFGHKKQKKPSKQERKTLRITASDVSIPDGIFKAESGEPLKQIPFTAISAEASGIVVVEPAQAKPYQHLVRPVSKASLALIVIAASADEAPAGAQIRFPARCEKTGEPIILTATIMQLGSVAVVRNAPTSIGQVEEVATQVIRILTYRDEHPEPWEDFLTKPVKKVIQHFEELQPTPAGAHRVIDCWDRQFLNLKLEKTKAASSELFVVTMRLEGVDMTSLLAKSGSNSMYVEPRDVTGKVPSEVYRVVWLSKHDKASSTLAQQTTQAWTSLVRSGQRFGLRVTAATAPQVHAQHKPNTPFLNTANLKIFQVGPWPYGATKATIHKVFQTWNWAARPVQPRNRAVDGVGLMWEVHAGEAPPFEVWHLAHGDVLISEIPRRQKPQHTPTYGIQGSQRTLEALTVVAPSRQRQADESWPLGDPWAQYEGVTKQARTHQDASSSRTGALAVNIGAIANQIEEKVLEKVNQHLTSRTTDDEDELMTEDPRIQSLESRMNQLEATMQSHHATQASQTQELAKQVETIHQKVDTQAETFRQHMDNRMVEQLSHIEKLLSRNHRE